MRLDSEAWPRNSPQVFLPNCDNSSSSPIRPGLLDFFSSSKPEVEQPSSSCVESNPWMNSEDMGEVEGEDERPAFRGILYIHVHHARNIHNICIYDNQDVFAKFSLTCSPDETLSTKIVQGGGRNPHFDESLQLKISQEDAVLKCEMWMDSRAKNYLEDQLLGFALVPLSSIVGLGRVTRDFPLSSTDLFHSPAGTVRLTLMFQFSEPCSVAYPGADFLASPSPLSSEAVLLDRKTEDVALADYTSVEFPDVEIARENQQMLSEFLAIASESARSQSNLKSYRIHGISDGPFLHLGASLRAQKDYDMTVNIQEIRTQTRGGSFLVLEDNRSPPYPKLNEGEHSYQTGVSSSTTTSLSEELNSREFNDQKSSMESSRSKMQTDGNSPDIRGGNVLYNYGELGTPNSEDAIAKDGKESAEGENFQTQEKLTKPLLDINVEPEESRVQQQIMEMYMNSMQQFPSMQKFTESLAKMTLPMDSESKASDTSVASDSSAKPTQKRLDPGKKDGSRVFYGSRAFF